MAAAPINDVLRIEDVNVKIKNAHILSDVTFTTCSGDFLAVMGPTGSGKTTLFNTIAGRQSASSGKITLSGVKLNKQIRRHIGLVLQTDVFYSNLTLMDTLYFTAMIRLPETVTTEEKLSRINKLVDQLDLRTCLNTVMGDMFNKGLSGGEKKRTSIACELLTDPDILLIDEPTSGLDSRTAFIVMDRIKEYADKYNKIVIVTVHQPSSQLYHMFDSLLLIENGKVVYFGGGQENPLNHFSSLGHHCKVNYNPADFYLELLKSERQVVDALIQGYRNKIKEDINTQNVAESNSAKAEKQANMLTGDGSLALQNLVAKDASTLSLVTKYSSNASMTGVETNDVAASNSTSRKWPTGFMTQLKMLTWRNFKHSRGRTLRPGEIVHYLVEIVIAGIVFFQIGHSPELIKEKIGVVFILLVVWGFDISMAAVQQLHEDKAVMSKERAAGSYRLSSYFLAKTSSELPLVVIMPTFFFICIFCTAGLGGVSEFFATWPIYMLNILTSQGHGLFFGAAVTDTTAALLANDAFLVVCILLSGMLTQTLPWWFMWAKYLSFLHHSSSAVFTTTTALDNSIPCNLTIVKHFSTCLQNSTNYVTSVDILHEAGVELPVYCYVSSLAIICLLFRVLTYMCLRWKRSIPI